MQRRKDVTQRIQFSLGNIAIQSVINSFGEDVMAGYGGVIKLQNLLVTALTTLGNGMSNYTAQNLGAGKKERIRPGFYQGLFMTFLEQ